MRLSIFVPHSPRSASEIEPYVGPLRDGHDGRLWLGQSMVVEPHQLLSTLDGIDTGTAVTLAPLRHPVDAAVQARSVALRTGRTHVAGFGAGSRRFQAGLRGEPYRSPLTAMAEYLSSVRELISKGSARRSGEYYTVTADLPPLESPAHVEIAAGVLRSGMAGVAGRYCDAAVTWLTPPEFIRDELVPAMATGADAAGRTSRPRAVAVVHVIVDHPGRDPLHQVITASRMHLAMPHYRKMLTAAGVPLDGDVVVDAALLVERGVYCFGSPADIVDQLKKWEDCGVDEVALNLAGAAFTTNDEDAVRADLDAILHEWALRQSTETLV
ncbi:LLM class flavin-dependent oxidoreductase [Rhodococcus sp. G-MC3]|uniref:LLM class flavin-dependent oxidoreductase n=1 Tax=Rhodococcus sp. G-MC3 TaxID=3046209 RepID=UPI0024BAE980|nr:LLM class flavin-dependent oxidoreductase [Rhodococcus sp. G-MC3]MDJ0393816.1 LLM class flavin-dependent oxidoreductase [Rhodococcus sp. G-MC3]